MGKQKKKTEENVEKHGKTGRIKEKYRKTGGGKGENVEKHGKQGKHKNGGETGENVENTGKQGESRKNIGT